MVVVGGRQPSSNDDLRVVLARLEVLERGGLGGSSSTDDLSQVAALSHRVDGLVEELKLVESRMRDEGFVIMDDAFLSMMDVETWSATYRSSRIPT